MSTEFDQGQPSSPVDDVDAAELEPADAGASAARATEEARLLDVYCDELDTAVIASGTPALRTVLDRYELRRPCGRFGFHAPGRPEPGPERVAELERLLLIESEDDDAWRDVAARCGTAPLGPLVVKDLMRLAERELVARLPVGAAADRTWSRALADAAHAAGPTLRLLSADDDEMPGALKLRHEACRAVWAQFLSDMLLAPAAIVDDDGRYQRHVLRADCCANLGRLGVKDAGELSELVRRSGAVVSGALLVDLRRYDGHVLRLAGLAMEADADLATSADWMEEREDPNPFRSDIEIERDQRRAARREHKQTGLRKAITRDVERVRDELVRIERRIREQIATQRPADAALLALSHYDGDVQAAQLGELYAARGMNAVLIDLSRAKTRRRKLLAEYGLIRARVDDDERFLGARHVVPECVGRVWRPARRPAARLQQLEHRLADALGTLPRAEDEARAIAAPLLQAAYLARQELREALVGGACDVVYEKGLVDKPRKLPTDLWRPYQRRDDGDQRPHYAGILGRVLIAPRRAEHVWRLDEDFLSRFPKAAAEQMRLLLEDDTPGQWYYFLNGGTRV